MLIHPIFAVVVLFVFLFAESADCQERIWTRADGKTLSAKLIGFRGNQAFLLYESEQVIGVDVDRLSEKDQAFIKPLLPFVRVGPPHDWIKIKSGRILVGKLSQDEERFIIKLQDGKTKRYSKNVVTEVHYGKDDFNDFFERLKTTSLTSLEQVKELHQLAESRKLKLESQFLLHYFSQIILESPPSDLAQIKQLSKYFYDCVLIDQGIQLEQILFKKEFDERFQKSKEDERKLAALGIRAYCLNCDSQAQQVSSELKKLNPRNEVAQAILGNPWKVSVTSVKKIDGKKIQIQLDLTPLIPPRGTPSPIDKLATSRELDRHAPLFRNVAKSELIVTMAKIKLIMRFNQTKLPCMGFSNQSSRLAFQGGSDKYPSSFVAHFASGSTTQVLDTKIFDGLRSESVVTFIESKTNSLAMIEIGKTAQFTLEFDLPKDHANKKATMSLGNQTVEIDW